MGENITSTLFLGIIIASAMIIGASLFTGTLLNNYSVPTEDLSYLNQTDALSDQMDQLKEKVTETTKITGIDVLDRLLVGAYETTKLIFGIGDLYESFITDTAAAIGLPSWFTSMLVIVVFIIVVFSIISIIVKWRT